MGKHEIALSSPLPTGVVNYGGIVLLQERTLNEIPELKIG